MEVDHTTLELDDPASQPEPAEVPVSVDDDKAPCIGVTLPQGDRTATGVTLTAHSTSDSPEMGTEASPAGTGDTVNIPMSDQGMTNLFRALVTAGAAHLRRIRESESGADPADCIARSRTELATDLESQTIFMDVPDKKVC